VAIQRHNGRLPFSRSRLESPNPSIRRRACLTYDNRIGEITNYYEEFRIFLPRVFRFLDSLKATVIPQVEIARLMKKVNPDRVGYQIELTCQAVREAAKLVEDYSGSAVDERDQKAREATQAPVRSQLHTLLEQICQKKEIKINTWLRDHDIDRSQYSVEAGRREAGGG
jgi:hypothetical protein